MKRTPAARRIVVACLVIDAIAMKSLVDAGEVAFGAIAGLIFSWTAVLAWNLMGMGD